MNINKELLNYFNINDIKKDISNFILLDIFLSCCDDNYKCSLYNLKNFMIMNRIINVDYISYFEMLRSYFDNKDILNVDKYIDYVFEKILDVNYIIKNDGEYLNLILVNDRREISKIHYYVNSKLRHLLFTSRRIKDNGSKNLEIKENYLKFNKLANRIKRQFIKKKLLGEIYISDNDYELLKSNFRFSYSRALEVNYFDVCDIPFVITIIEIAKRNYYNNRFWPYFSEEFSDIKFDPKTVNLIYKVFRTTLVSYGKNYNESDYVEGILLHSFVSDKYLYDFYNFLFNYYEQDLLRNIKNNNRISMDELMQVIKSETQENYGYLIKKHTSLAADRFETVCRNIIKRILNRMDKLYWNETDLYIHLNYKNRFYCNLVNWAKQKFEYNYKSINITNKQMSKKALKNPHMDCDLKNNVFKIVFPDQYINSIDSISYKWEIVNYKLNKSISGNLVQTITKKIKTNTDEIQIDISDVFDEFNICLYVDGKIYKKYKKINSSNFRIFDINGKLVSSNTVIKGEYIIFALESELPINEEALLHKDIIGKYVKAIYDLNEGDLLKLPNNLTISVGDKYFEGLQRRYVVSDAKLIVDNRELEIHNKTPKIRFNIDRNALDGVAVKYFRNGSINTYNINQFNYSISEHYYLNHKILVELDINKIIFDQDGIHKVIIDVPNDKIREYEFGLINNFHFEFKNSPYVISSSGVITFDKDVILKALSDIITDFDNVEHVYKFDINPFIKQLEFDIFLKERNYELKINIPYLKWKFDDIDYRVNVPEDLWISEMPRYLYINFPLDKVYLVVSSEDENDEISDFIIAPYKKNEDDFVFDLFKLKIDNQKVNKLNVYISYRIDNQQFKHKFMNIYMKSIIRSTKIKGNFEEKYIEIYADILGKSEYFVEMTKENDEKVIINKEKLNDGYLKCESDIESGFYQLFIYEKDKVKSLFKTFKLIYSVKQSLINEKDLQGTRLKILKIKNVKTYFTKDVSLDYIININKKMSDVSYKGNLLMIKDNQIAFTDMVKINFLDNEFDKITISFYDSKYNEYELYLYDTLFKTITKNEDRNLSTSDKYFRYDVLYEEDYYFVCEFLRENINIENYENDYNGE